MTDSYLLKGFRDYSLEDAQIREKMIDLIKQVYASFGFSPLQTPVIERKEVLVGKYGESAEKLMYLFQDNGGREVGLRYDLTIPSMRFLADNLNKTIFLPYKRYQIQEVFRAEKPQKGRLRQFIQADIDIYGSSSVFASAEIIFVIDTVLQQFKIPDYVFRLNSRTLVVDYLRSLGYQDNNKINEILRVVDKLDKKSKDEVIAELDKDLGVSGREILLGFNQLRANSRISEIIGLAKDLGVAESRLEFSPFMVRGLDYYTDEIFEVVLKNSSLGSIAGGGRYDNLFSQFAKESVPAVGGSIGFERLFEVIKANQVFSRQKKLFVPLFSNLLFKQQLADIVKILARQGYSVFVYPEESDIKKQLRYANKYKFDYAIFYGENEAQKNVVKIKNLASGNEEAISIARLGSYKF